jgi:hypothetical protein
MFLIRVNETGFVTVTLRLSPMKITFKDDQSEPEERKIGLEKIS